MYLKSKIEKLLKSSFNADYRALKAIANAEIYLKQAYEGRYLFELIQNARDANRENKINGTIKIELKDKCLVVSNTGAPFTGKGIESITTIGQSTKNSTDYIGHKGIGFKSVLEITQNPIIKTKYGSIIFDRKRTYNSEEFKEKEKIIENELPIFYFPHYEENRLMDNDKFTTEITIPLTDYKYVKIEENFSSLSEKQLILLGNIEKIVFVNQNNEELYFRIKEKGKSNTVEIISNNNVEKFKVFQPEKPISTSTTILQSLDSKDKELFEENKEIEIKILLQIDNKKHFIPIENSKLYLYYPLETTSGFNFLIHASFIVTPDRTRLRKNDLNDFILESIGKFICSEMLSALKRNYKNTKVISILSYKRIPDSKLELLYNTIQERLKKEKFIFDKNTNRFYSPNEIIIGDGFDKGLFPSKKLLGKAIIYLEEKEGDWLKNEFNCDYLTNELILNSIESECKLQRKQKNFKYFENLYNYVSDIPKFNIEGKKIFLTTTNKLVTNNESIFYGGRKEKYVKELPKSLRNSIYFINDNINLSKFRSEKLNKTGIVEFALREFIRRIITFFDKEQVSKNDILTVLLKVDYQKHSSSRAELFNKVKLPVVGNNNWASLSGDIVYFDNENLKELYPNAKFIDFEKIQKISKCNDVEGFLKYCGVWDIPAVYLKDENIIKNTETRDSKLGDLSYLSSRPFYVKNDRVLDRPVKHNERFTNIIIDNWDRYSDFLTDFSFPNFQYASAKSEYRNINDAWKYSDFISFLTDEKWLSIKGKQYTPNEVFVLNKIDFNRPHLKIIQKYIPVISIDYTNANKLFINEIGILHFDNFTIKNYSLILEKIYQLNKGIKIDNEFKLFYGRILSKLYDAYEIGKGEDLSELKSCHFLSVNSMTKTYEWVLAKDIFYIDNKQFYDQLPASIKKILQPTFTNRDKNTFGKIASNIGKTISKYVNNRIEETEIQNSVSLKIDITKLHEIIALLEFNIDRALSEEEIKQIKEANILFKEEIPITYIVDGQPIEDSVSTPYFIDRKNKEIHTKYDFWKDNQAVILNDLFTSLLDRDIKKFNVVILEPYFASNDKKTFLEKHDIVYERIIEIKSLLSDKCLSNEQNFWWGILKCKNIDYDESLFIKSSINDSLISEKLTVSAQIILTANQTIDFSDINNTQNITYLNNLFGQLNITISKYNSVHNLYISFKQYFISELQKKKEQLEPNFETWLYQYIKSDNSYELKQRFQKLLDCYKNEINYNISNDDLEINLNETSSLSIKGKFSYFDLTIEELERIKPINLNEIFKKNYEELETYFLNKKIAINCEKIIESLKLRSLLYFDYKLLIDFKDDFVTSKKESDNNGKKEPIIDKYKDHKNINIAKTTSSIDNNYLKRRDSKTGNRIDGGKSQKSRQDIGLIAEKCVYEKLKSEGYNSLKWVSKNASKIHIKHIGYNPEGDDGNGYDIEYIDDNGAKLFVEVKGRVNNEESFYITETELEFARKNIDNYKIIFVKNVKDNELREYHDMGNIFSLTDGQSFNNNSKFTSIGVNYLITFNLD